MLLNASKKTSKLKRVVYLLASMILGFLLGFIVYALVGINYLQWFIDQGGVWPFRMVLFVLLVLEVVLLVAGFVGGLFLGRFWWRKVYVERAWARRSRRK